MWSKSIPRHPGPRLSMLVQLDSQSCKQKSLKCSSMLYLNCSKEIKGNLMTLLKMLPFLSSPNFLHLWLLSFPLVSTSAFSNFTPNSIRVFKPRPLFIFPCWSSGGLTSPEAESWPPRTQTLLPHLWKFPSLSYTLLFFFSSFLLRVIATWVLWWDCHLWAMLSKRRLSEYGHEGTMGHLHAFTSASAKTLWQEKVKEREREKKKKQT